MSRARDIADGTFSGSFSADSPTLVVDDTNNRVGVGTTSPTATLESIGGQLRIAASSASSMFLVNPSTTYSDGVELQATYNGGGSFGPLKFSTSGSERARIDSSGNLLVGKTAAGAATAGFETRSSGYTAITRDGGQPLEVRRLTSDGVLIDFRKNGSTVGSISVTASATSYNTSSDYRLKENVTELTGAIDRVKQVPVHRFNFISNPDKTVDGFLAHEVADVVPEAITGTKDEVDEEGSPVHQGIDQSKLVPLLTQALKDAITKIEALEARVATLEAV